MIVGVVGLGLMGSSIANRLLSTGYQVTVYNRDITKAKPFAKRGAIVAKSPKEMAEDCNFILICVSNIEAINKVSFGKNGIVASNPKRLIVADSSTISPEQSLYCNEIFRKYNIDHLAMPVMGGPAAAERGELVLIISGNKNAFKIAKPIVEKIAKNIFYIGNNVDSANALKLALNLNIALIATAIAEGIILVKRSGVAPGIFVKILNSTYFKTGLSQIKGPKMVDNNFETSFHLRNMLKDLELTTITAQNIGISLPLTTLAQQIFRAASNSGFSEQDYTAIAAFLAKINGMNGKKRRS
jgi:3-hydroxyisobutyrate dehydrogenase